MSEKLPRIVEELNKASEEEVAAADKFLQNSVLKNSTFGTDAMPDYRIKKDSKDRVTEENETRDPLNSDDDFQDTVIEGDEPHDFLNSDTLKNSEVLGLDLTETPGDLSRAEAVLHKPQAPARVMQNTAERPQTFTGLLNDHSLVEDTIGYQNSPEGRRQARKASVTEVATAPKSGLLSKIKNLFGG